MRRFFLRLLCLSLFSVAALQSMAQDQRLIDSIRQVLPSRGEDTTKAALLIQLGWEVSYADLEKGLTYCQEGLELSKKLNYAKGEGDAWNAIGTIYHDLADYARAIEAHQQAIKIREKSNNPTQLGKSYLNTGIVYVSMGDPKKCITYMKMAIANFQLVNNEKALASCYNNLGTSFSDIGLIDSSLHYFMKGEELARKTNALASLAVSLSGIAVCRARQGDFTSADLMIGESIRLLRENKMEYELVSILGSLAEVRLRESKYDEAIAAVEEARMLAAKIGKMDTERTLVLQLSGIYEQAGRHKEALGYYKLYSYLRDSLYGENSQRRLREMEAQFDKEKREREIDTLKHTNEQQELITQRQTLILVIVIVALVFLAILAVLLFARNASRKRANELLQHQKSIIEEKNKNITDSISYAQKIQEALLPTPGEFNRSGLKEGFVFFRPKDIVSGDFYWMSVRGDHIFLAIADCTGHGVPGGFMSMLGAALLNEIINDRNLTEPGAILDLMREKVIVALRQTGSTGESKDGMDMVLWRYNKQTLELCYAAGNNSFYIVRNGELLEQNPDKQPVGYHAEQRPFSQHCVQLMPNDCLYAFTDGYADQFGGPQGKKLKYRRFQETLLKNYQLNMHEQDMHLGRTFANWKGELEQVDDVLVIGIRI